jgi:uncharacterized protein YigE (DUF2233 family)
MTNFATPSASVWKTRVPCPVRRVVSLAFALTITVGLTFAPDANAQWKVIDSETLPAAEGLTHTCQTLQRTGGGEGLLGPRKETVHFVCFNSRRHTFRVIEQGLMSRESVGDVLQKNRCLAGVNGGYFAPDFEPVGLLMSDGHLLNRPQRSPRVLTGALIVTPNRISFRRASEPLPGKDASQAVQAGPFLVEDGKLVVGLNNLRTARRTAVVTDGESEWGLVSSSSVTLEELGAILADPALIPGGMKIRRALNLDGGSSTALWVQRPGAAAPFYLTEFGIVRDFVGIVPR